MRLLFVVALVSVMATSGAALAQTDDARFEEDVLRRLDRLERMVDRLERQLERASADDGRSGGRQDVVAAVSLMCHANCGAAAQTYCRQTGFVNGVPLQIERRGFGNFEHVVRVRCFN